MKGGDLLLIGGAVIAGLVFSRSKAGAAPAKALTNLAANIKVTNKGTQSAAQAAMAAGTTVRTHDHTVVGKTQKFTPPGMSFAVDWPADDATARAWGFNWQARNFSFGTPGFVGGGWISFETSSPSDSTRLYREGDPKGYLPPGFVLPGIDWGAVVQKAVEIAAKLAK